METYDASVAPSRSEHLRILIASFAAYGVANVSGWILPDLINEFITVNRLSESEAGFVGTVELAALAITSIVLARFAGRRPFLHIAVAGTAVAVIFTVASIFVQNHAVLLLLRAITGVGEGATLMVASAAVASFANPDRAYGQMNVVNILYGTGLILALPVMSKFAGESAAFPTLLAGLLLLAPLIFLMPRTLALDVSVVTDGTAVVHHHSISRRVYLLAATMFVIGMNSSAVWSFLVLLGTRAGLTPDEAIHAVALVAFVSVSGSALATVLGTRFGRLKPTVLAVAVMTICIVILTTSRDPLAYRVCASVLVAALYFLIPYFMGYAAADDDTGRGAALVGGSFLLTVALAPYTGGLLIEHFGFGTLSLVAVVTNTVATLAIAWFDSDLRRNPPRDNILHH